MAQVRIYLPEKNPMQSGRAKTHEWIMAFVPETPYFIDPLMGWSGQRDTTRQLNMRFPSKEAAIAYANRENLSYEVIEPKRPVQKRKSYADNFSFKKIK